MDRLCSILEEAQSVMNHDDLAYQIREANLNFPGMGSAFYNPVLAPSMLKSTAHKASKPVVKKRTWKKPKDKPKRPLSAYNLFFQHERKEIIAVLPEDKSVAEDGLTEDERRRKHRKTHGKIGFADLARSIALKWKNLSEADRAVFVTEADIEKERYKKEVDAWKKLNKDDPKKPKAEKKKAAPRPLTPPVATLVSPSVSKVTPSRNMKPEALSSMLTSTVTAQRAQLLQLMASTQALASQLRQQNNTHNNMYESFLQNTQDNMMQQRRTNFQRHFNQEHQQSSYPRTMNNNFNSTMQMNPHCTVDLTASMYEVPQMQQQRVETFSRETFFEDNAPVAAEPDVFSISSDSSEEKQVSLEDDINAFMDDFDSEIMLP